MNKAIILEDIKSSFFDKNKEPKLYAVRREQVIVTKKRDDGTFLVKSKKEMFIAQAKQLRFIDNLS